MTPAPPPPAISGTAPPVEHGVPGSPAMAGLSWLLLSSADVPSGEGFLSAAERATLARLTFAKRRADWLLGRWTAKRAVLSYLGDQAACPEGRRFDNSTYSTDVPFAAEAAISIVAAPDGAPEVLSPDGPAPAAVSIAHSGGRGLAVAGPRAAVFGADIETIAPRDPDFLADFFTEREREWVESLGAADRAWGATLVWSAKEAVLKALRVGLREDTRAVEITVEERTQPRAPPGEPASPWHAVTAELPSTGRRFEGSARVVSGQVVTILGA